MVYDGQVFSAGEVPGTQEIRAIAAWLDQKPPEPVMATASLGLEEEEFAPIIGVASGVVAVTAVKLARRVSSLVPAGAGAHRDLGRRSVQSRHHR